MDATELLENLIKYLNPRLNADVKVAGDDERSTPAVLIETWNVSPDGKMKYVDSEFDNSGVEQARIYHLPYEMEVDFKIMAEGALEASNLRSSLKHDLAALENDPKKLSDHLAAAYVSDGGGINYQFANPSEAVLQQTASFRAAFVYRDEDGTAITDFGFEVVITE